MRRACWLGLGLGGHKVRCPRIKCMATVPCHSPVITPVLLAETVRQLANGIAAPNARLTRSISPVTCGSCPAAVKWAGIRVYHNKAGVDVRRGYREVPRISSTIVQPARYFPKEPPVIRLLCLPHHLLYNATRFHFGALVAGVSKRNPPSPRRPPPARVVGMRCSHIGQ